MPQVTLNDITLHYLDEGYGEPIVFLHGLGSCGEDWVLQTQFFASRFRVLAPDLRGHGRSSKPAGPYSAALFASDVAALLDRLSIEHAHVVGLSLGGLVAQQLAIECPDRVRTLTLTNTFAHLIAGNVLELMRLLRRGVISLVLPLERSAHLVAQGLFPYPHQVELRRLTVQRLTQNERAAYRASLAAVRRFDSRRALARITCPTLIITGERDRTVPRSRQGELACGIRGARWEIIRDSGHATPIDQPEIYNRLLLSAFDQVGQV
ncbi:MAG TPA: alpha/beta hydrolase [Anaerolineae bacterium]|nr:alpha/beta hydrolase [Anaerolineae bacterium]